MKLFNQSDDLIQSYNNFQKNLKKILNKKKFLIKKNK